MNKKLLLAGAFAAVGFIGLTAFGGQTREQQEAEIAAAVTGKLDELRATLETTCNERIATEAQSRFDAWLLAEAAKPSKPGVSKPKPVTSKPKGKPSVDPLPQPTTPPVSDPKKDKMDQQKNDPSNTGGKKDKMEQQKTDPSNTNSKKDKMKQQSGNQ